MPACPRMFQFGCLEEIDSRTKQNTLLSQRKVLRFAIMTDDSQYQMYRKVLSGLKYEISQLQEQRRRFERTDGNLQLKFGLRSSSGNLVTAIYHTEEWLENRSKSTATFRIFEGTFTITLMYNGNDVEEVKLDLKNTPTLWEVEEHLMSLTVHKNSQRIIFDIMAYQKLYLSRKFVLDSLYKRNLKGLKIVLPEPKRNVSLNSPIIKASNSSTSEIYFELKWCICYSKNYKTFCHKFNFKCTPQGMYWPSIQQYEPFSHLALMFHHTLSLLLDMPGNEEIRSLISSLDNPVCWMEDENPLLEQWEKISKWVSKKNSL